VCFCVLCSRFVLLHVAVGVRLGILFAALVIRWRVVGVLDVWNVLDVDYVSKD